MQARSITMLGTGLIGDFYTMTLHGQRGRDSVRVVYSRSAERGAAFQERWNVPESTTDLEAAIRHPETDVVIVGVPNFMHEEAVSIAAATACEIRAARSSSTSPGSTITRTSRPARIAYTRWTPS